jgi:group I intron endonuclease
MKIYTIYKAINLTNGKCYIGFDSNWPKRKYNHKKRYKNYNLKFYDAIKKYGWDNFEWEIIYQSLDGPHTLNYMEKYFIEAFNSLKNGYNMTLGGEGTIGYKHSEESILKNKMKNSGINHYNWGKHISEETKSKISLANSGENNGMFGKKVEFSPEHKLKISKQLKNKPKTQQHKDNLKLAKKKSTYIISDETKLKMSKSKQKSIILHGIQFESLKKASEHFGVHYTTICRWIKNGK